MKKVSIIMAVYNEKASIAAVLEKIQAVDIPLEKEIIIVDGCSNDGTRELLQEITSNNVKLILEEKRSGKGAALRLGFKHSTGDIILIQDADLEINPFEYPALLAPILEEKADIVYGSRFMKGRGKTGAINYLGNRLMTKTANVLFGSRLTDIETCYKVFKKDLLHGLEFFCSGFDFDAELTAAFLKSRKSIYEVPISYEPRGAKDGKKLHWITGLTSLEAIIRRRFLNK